MRFRFGSRAPAVLAVVVLVVCYGVARAQQPAAEVQPGADVNVDAAAQPPAAPDAPAHAHGPEGHGHAGHEVHVGSEGVSSKPEEFKRDLSIYTFIVFLLLAAILWKFAWGPISQGLEKREQRIAEHIAAAERSNLEAKNMLAEYERKLASSADEVRAIIDEARRDAEHTQQEILAKARADAQTERDRSLREIETARDQALKELGERSANLAVDLAGKIVQAHLSASDHTRLIEEAMARFPQGSPSKN